MRDEELARQPGGVATRPGDDQDAAVEPVFSPKDFKLNLSERHADADVDADDPLPNLDSPAIRKLTWEHVVPDRPASSAPSAATIVPLPPPDRVPPPPPPLPPQPVVPFEPPPPAAEATATVVEPELAEVAFVDDEVEADEVADVELEADADAVEDDVAIVEPVVVEPAKPAIEPEVNRLGLIPDLVDDDSPIELPPITPSGSTVAHSQPVIVYAPVLAESLYVPPPQRLPTTTVAVVAPERKNKKKQYKSNRKPKRRLLRTFMTLIVLFGLLGGGAYAAKKYLLHPLTWSTELKPLADDVAAARGLEFKSSVQVTQLPIADYATRLAESVISTPVDRAPVWRALGLVNGELDLEAVGRQALNDAPAFYDPATNTIVVTDDLKSYEHLYRFALRRALTAALLDQQYDWSARLATATPAAALGIRATIDGDALAVANSLAINDSPDQLSPELLSFLQAHDNVLSPSQYATALAGRVGVAMRPAILTMATDSVALAAFEQATPGSDDVLDAGRVAATTASPGGTQGMMFWYYVLASRIDDTQAWSAAVRWTGDSLTPAAASTPPCVDATVSAGDAEGAVVLLGALQAWAAAAPAESTTTVALVDGNQIAVHACDPSAAVTAPLPVKIPVVFGGAGVEQLLVQSAINTARDTTVDPVCVVTAARLRGAALTSPADDAPVLAVSWAPPYVAANIDLAGTCTAAPPG